MNELRIATPDSCQESKPHDRARPRRQNIWDLPGSCHCMIIGTCLTLADVKGVAKKCRYPVNGKSDYQLHQFFVGQAAHGDSLIARQTQKLLNKKYRTEISQLKSADNEADLLNQWQTFSDCGKIGAGVWAIFTHPSCTHTVMDMVFGDVHMLSHLSGASVHLRAAELPAVRHEVEMLRNKLVAQKLSSAKRLKSYQYEVIRLENVNQQLHDQLARVPPATADKDLLSKQDGDRIKSLLRETNQVLRTTRAQLHTARTLADERQRQIEEQKHDTDKLEQLVGYLVQKSDQTDSTYKDASRCSHSLSGKCVLLLGGMPSQCKHFRAFVESNDGDFLHHDGGVESSYSHIDQLVSRADAVFCPVEQVSHTAINRAKKLCKKSETPLVFLPKSSLSAFVSGIRAIQ